MVGNDDGAHHIGAILFQGLNDVGLTIPAHVMTYCNVASMSGDDYKDLDETPEPTKATTATLALHAMHLARLLKVQNHLPPG